MNTRPLQKIMLVEDDPDIQEVAVTEIRVRSDVSIIAAFVVPTEASEPDAASIMKWAEEKLAAYKCPREVIFVESLPRTANGKVMRRALSSS